MYITATVHYDIATYVPNSEGEAAHSLPITRTNNHCIAASVSIGYMQLKSSDATIVLGSSSRPERSQLAWHIRSCILPDNWSMLCWWVGLELQTRAGFTACWVLPLPYSHAWDNLPSTGFFIMCMPMHFVICLINEYRLIDRAHPLKEHLAYTAFITSNRLDVNWLSKVPENKRR